MKTVMRRRNLLGLLVLAVLVSALSGATKAKIKTPAPPAITRLAWLAGNWRLEVNGRITDEQWMVPGGGVMLGMTRTAMKGRLEAHEFRQIRSGPGGALYYVARFGGQDETPYKAGGVTDTTV